MDTSTERRADAPPVEPDRRSRRGIWLTLAGLAIVVILDLVLVGLSSQEVRRHLESGRDALRSGDRALRDGDTELATAVFAEAGDEFRAAAGETRTPWYSLASWVPVLGRTPDTVRAISDAGVETADAAAVIARALHQVPGGVGGLAPRFGAIPLEPLPGLAAAVERAAELTHRALERLETSSDAFVLGSVAEARQDALEAIRPLDRQLRAGALILRGLPGLLGQDEPKRYYFGAANPAEERGTGGLIGAYSILTVDGGRLSFSSFQPVQSLPELPAGTWPSPSAQYVENAAYYWTNDDFWLNTNLTPDFPLAAGTIAMSYEAAVGGPLDGVIVADPFALEALMRVTGPVSIRGVGVRVAPSRIVRFVSNEAYALFDTDDERKAVLGDVAADVLTAFLLLPGDDLAKQRALLRAFDGGHVKVWSADPTTQEGLALTTAGGAFRPEGTDAIALITNSASGSKLDFYQRRIVSYGIKLQPDGSATATLGASLENDSPTSGFPAYVIGPNPGRTRHAGRQRRRRAHRTVMRGAS